MRRPARSAPVRRTGRRTTSSACGGAMRSGLTLTAAARSPRAAASDVAAARAIISGAVNKYLSYDEERAPKVRAMFTRLAWRYDLVNDVMSFGLHRRWKRQTVAIALAGGRERLLDLCCGTGDLGFLAEERGSSVTGLDFTLPMLAVAPRCKGSSGGR